MDPDFRTKKLKYSDPDPTLTDPTFYYPDPDSVHPNIRIFESDPDRISDQIRIESRIGSGSDPDQIRISDKSSRLNWLVIGLDSATSHYYQ